MNHPNCVGGSVKLGIHRVETVPRMSRFFFHLVHSNRSIVTCSHSFFTDPSPRRISPFRSPGLTKQQITSMIIVTIPRSESGVTWKQSYIPNFFTPEPTGDPDERRLLRPLYESRARSFPQEQLQHLLRIPVAGIERQAFPVVLHGQRGVPGHHVRLS